MGKHYEICLRDFYTGQYLRHKGRAKVYDGCITYLVNILGTIYIYDIYIYISSRSHTTLTYSE